MPLSLERKTTPVPFATHVRRPLPAPGAREGLRVLIASHSSAQRHPTLAWFLGEPHNARLCDTLESFIAGLTAPQAIDLAVVDCALTESDCMAGLRVVRQRRPHLPVIVLCRQTCCSRRTAVSLLQEGATGLLPWEMPPHLIDAALPLMMDGQRFAPPDLLVDLAAPGDVGAAAASEMRPAPDPREALTRLHFSPRECDVAVYLAQGYANKEIAHRQPRDCWHRGWGEPRQPVAAIGRM